MEKLLELENVSYSYQDGKEKNKILEKEFSFEEDVAKLSNVLLKLK